MPIYKQTTEIANIDKVWANINKDIVEVYFGDKNVFTVWAEIENALPLTVYASGDDLVNYKVFGNTESGESVGELTENLFDPNATDTTNGYLFSAYLPASGNIVIISSETPSFAVSEYIGVPNDNFITLVNVGMVGASRLAICFYDANKEYISGTEYGSDINKTVEIPSGSVYFRFTIVLSAISSIMIVPGSIAPTSYIPYGYQLPMSVSDGTTTTTTPIYIGSDPLGENEYISYSEQKVYKRTSNLFDIRKVPSNIVTITGNNEFQKAETEEYWYDLFDHQTSVSPSRPADTTKSLYLEAGTYTLSGTATRPDDDDADLNNILTVRSNGDILAGTTLPYTFTLAADDYITIRLGTEHRVNMSQIMITAGSETPSTYEPYLTPIDPPVAIPALPTVDGETIIEYNPTPTPAVEPDKMYAKYRKQGT